MNNLNRRSFLQLGLSVTLAGLVPVTSMASRQTGPPPARSLSFYNTHTREHLDICYFRDGRYQADALSKINTILRDHRTNEIQPIDLKLLDLLDTLSRRINRTEPFHVISGYRSPGSNAQLRKKSKGVARRSLHMTGRAIDLRVPGFSTEKLRKTAIAMKAGGVGYYPSPNFVHLDTGRVRFW